jgi:hypothetical protein
MFDVESELTKALSILPSYTATVFGIPNTPTAVGKGVYYIPIQFSFFFSMSYKEYSYLLLKTSLFHSENPVLARDERINLVLTTTV